MQIKCYLIKYAEQRFEYCKIKSVHEKTRFLPEASCLKNNNGIHTGSFISDSMRNNHVSLLHTDMNFITQSK